MAATREGGGTRAAVRQEKRGRQHERRGEGGCTGGESRAEVREESRGGEHSGTAARRQPDKQDQGVAKL